VLSYSIIGTVTLRCRATTGAGKEFLTERQIVMTGDAAETATLIEDHSWCAELIRNQIPFFEG